jgi:hypothetical protein
MFIVTRLPPPPRPALAALTPGMGGPPLGDAPQSDSEGGAGSCQAISAHAQ